MSANQFGSRFCVTTFGESHGSALGAVLDGCPAGITFDENLLRNEMARRRPGQSNLVTARNEEDSVEILSGVFEGKTLGTPIAMIVRNHDTRSEDYREIAASPRNGHADDTWSAKFGHRDHRGGGRSSGRETVSRVMAGAVARMFLQAAHGTVHVRGWTDQVGDLSLPSQEKEKIWNANVDSFAARFPSTSQSDRAKTMIENAKSGGNSLGGVAEIAVRGVPAGWGQPVFHKLKADLASAYMGVGATTAVEIGAGVASAHTSGQEFHAQADSAVYGGIRGGLSTGDEIRVRVHFKPTSSIMDVAKKGRHDPFIVTRAVPVLEAMTWLVLADHALWSRQDR